MKITGNIFTNSYSLPSIWGSWGQVMPDKSIKIFIDHYPLPVMKN